MKIYGTSVLKGLLYTLKTFVDTYVEDFKRLSGKGQPENGLRSYSEGVVTVQYPDVAMPIGATYERFRVLPMLIYDKKENGEQETRCTSCGICAKVCPPQCIWIVQQTDDAGKPIPKPDEFFIDTSVCMNCGLCSEFCPFDAIKMDHQFELTVTENRRENYVYDIDKLHVPAEYYAQVRPQASATEDETRRKDEEAKKAKEEAKKAAAAAKAAAAKEEAATPAAEGAAVTAGAEKPAKKVLTDEEKAAMKEAALKKAAELKAKKAAEKAAAEAGTADGTPVAEAAETAPSAPESSETPAEKPAKKVLSDEEKAALKEAALKKAAEVKAKKAAEKAAAEKAATEAAAEPAPTTENSTPPAEEAVAEVTAPAPEKETEA
ncbi:MAG: 4Fe-4S binding protein [Candidatus Sericytochromatia bacterium]|nr:4Fe-4S binding protein [Candidatus Sericytochromatia bacterium]